MRWDLIGISEAAKLSEVHVSTLRRNESADGEWTEVNGNRFRVYRVDSGPRRYDRLEIIRQMVRLRKAR